MTKRKLKVKKSVVRSLTKKQADAARGGWAGYSSSVTDPSCWPSCNPKTCPTGTIC